MFNLKSLLIAVKKVTRCLTYIARYNYDNRVNFYISIVTLMLASIYIRQLVCDDDVMRMHCSIIFYWYIRIYHNTVKFLCISTWGGKINTLNVCSLYLKQ